MKLKKGTESLNKFKKTHEKDMLEEDIGISLSLKRECVRDVRIDGIRAHTDTDEMIGHHYKEP